MDREAGGGCLSFPYQGRVPLDSPVLSLPLTNLPVSRQPQLCHPERTPDFLLRSANQRPRMRLSLPHELYRRHRARQEIGREARDLQFPSPSNLSSPRAVSERGMCFNLRYSKMDAGSSAGECNSPPWPFTVVAGPEKTAGPSPPSGFPAQLCGVGVSRVAFLRKAACVAVG